MKNKLLIVFLIFIGFNQIQAQQVQTLSLKEAVNLGIENNKLIKASEAQVSVAEKKLKSTKTMQYPDLSISSQYLHLFDTTNVDLKIQQNQNQEETGTESSSSGASPSPSYLMYGMASVSMSVFNGFKLRNSIKQSEFAVNLSKIQSEEKKEDVVYQILQIYFSLYKTKKSLEVLKENEIRAEQRVNDFKNFMDSGLLARNDYLRSTLQLSNVKLAEEEAKTTYENLNYQLNILLGLPEETKIEINTIENLNVLPAEDADLANRKDLQAMEEQLKIADSQIKIEKGNYYPSLSLSGGYMAIDIDDIATVTNATNVGIGLSYNLASIFKNKSKVEEAKAEKTMQQALLDAQTDQAKVEIKKAFNDYNLALKKENVFEEAKAQADENYRIVKDKYDNGLSDTDQLLEADIEQLQAQINQTIGDVDTLLALYKYVYTQGKLMEVLQ